MDAFWAAAATVALFAVTLGAFPWLASRVRRGGTGAGLLAPFQDIWDPAVHHTQTEIHAQLDRKAPTPSPDDPPWADRLTR